MTRWILSSIALHAALVIFVCISALLSRPEKDEDIFVVDLSAGMEASQPEPEQTPGEPEPEPTEEKEVTKVPTEAPTKKETPKPVPTKKETPKTKPTKKKTPIPIRTLPPQLRAKATPPPNPEPRRVDRQEKLEKIKKEIKEKVNEPVNADPEPVPTRRTVRKPTNNTLDVSTTGGRRNSNYYLAMLQNQLYQNWEHKTPQGGTLRKGEVNIVVLKDGTIDVNRCEWNRRSGDSSFDDSVWETLKKIDLPDIPTELRVAEIKVTVTFRDEV
jgi:outer membrane biosynthesis protein TonB